MTDPAALIEAQRLLAEMERKYADSPLKARDMEADFQAFLSLVERSGESRDAFVSLFTEILNAARTAPEWLVAYCMHALRWPEVLAVAERERRRGQPATLSLAVEVVDAYSDDWVGKDLFDRFAE